MTKLKNSKRIGREWEKRSYEILNEWLISSGSEFDMRFLDGGLCPPATSQRFGKTWIAGAQDIFNDWDGWMLYSIYGSKKPTLYLFQTRSRFVKKDMEYLQGRAPVGAMCYYAIYNEPPAKMKDKFIGLPICTSKTKLWVMLL